MNLLSPWFCCMDRVSLDMRWQWMWCPGPGQVKNGTVCGSTATQELVWCLGHMFPFQPDWHISSQPGGGNVKAGGEGPVWILGCFGERGDGLI